MQKGLCGLLVAGLFWTVSCKNQDRPAGGASASSGMVMGKKIFLEKCAPCHGREGKGNGPAAVALNPKPRDFTAGVFKYGGSREEVIRTIGHGIPGTAMARWDSQLTREQIEAVSDYVRSLTRKPSPAARG